MKCSIVQDLLPLYADNLTSNETNIAIEDHLSECETCAKYYHDIIDMTEHPSKPTKDEFIDVNKIKELKKRVTLKIVKILIVFFSICAIIFFLAIYRFSITYPVTKDNINITTTNNNNNWTICLETEAGKRLSFDSKTENILDASGNVCEQKVTIYNLQYKKSINNEKNHITWEYSSANVNFIINLEDDVINLSNGTVQNSSR